MSIEHFLNADFDLSLRPRWSFPDGASAQHRITDLAWHALFLAEEGDSVIIPETVPDGFAAFLQRRGIPMPTLTVEPNLRAGRRFSPMGWNADTSSRNQLYNQPVDHPCLEIVTRVNGRRFSAEIEEACFGGSHTISVLEDESELCRQLESLRNETEGWVLKAEHGNAGLGNRRLRTSALGDGDLKVVRRMFEEDDVVILERWRHRLRDLCSIFAVTSRGEVDRFALHEVINTSDGALIGSLFEEDSAVLAEWRAPMVEATEAVAQRLAETGYVGPVCMDAFVWDDHGHPKLRPLVDLNARREMSAGASTLWRRLGGRGAAYWRFFSRRKIRLPDSYTEVEDALGGDLYTTDRGAGTLVTAPLWLGPNRRPTAKAAVLFLGRDRDEVFALDNRFRERFKK